MEAARGIADHRAQLAFLLLTINVFLGKLRKTKRSSMYSVEKVAY